MPGPSRRAGPGLAAAVALVALVACGRPPPPAATADGPARRIVTLSPHLAELVYAAGAGDRLVGVVEFSDFPPPVARLPRVGDAFRVDYEAVAALAPDLVLAWTSGNAPETVQRLRDLGYRVVTLEPVRLEDVAAHVERIGALAGTAAVAGVAAEEFRARLAALAAGAAGAAPLSVFVQLSVEPWFTVTDRHFLGQGLRLCGGRNVFGGLPGLTAIVSLESIVEAAPQAIVASDMGAGRAAALAVWSRWPGVPAVRDGALYVVDADLLSRPSARILDGIAELCDVLADARRRAPAGTPAP
jgi:iron complex transport system substrate-binding protein